MSGRREPRLHLWSRIIPSPSLGNFRDPASRFGVLAEHRCGFQFPTNASHFSPLTSFGPPGIEPGLHAPEACVLPAYSGPLLIKSVNGQARFYRHQGKLGYHPEGQCHHTNTTLSMCALRKKIDHVSRMMLDSRPSRVVPPDRSLSCRS